jgi:hypothetical protein
MALGLPEWRHKAIRSERGAVVLLDEINGSPAHQKAFHYVIHQGIPNAIVVSAMNPTESATDGYELSPAFVNRMYIHNWVSEPAAWCQAMMSGKFDENFPILPENWRDKLPFARALVAGYITKSAVKLQMFPKEQAKRSQPWASKRSWTNVGTLLAAAQSIGADMDLSMQLASGCVGHEAAVEFMQWQKELDLPDVKAWLKNPKSYKRPDRHDILYTALGSMVAEIMSHAGANLATSPEYRDAWGAGLQVMEKVCAEDREIGFSTIALLMQKAPENADPLLPKKLFKDVIKLQGKLVA